MKHSVPLVQKILQKQLKIFQICSKKNKFSKQNLKNCFLSKSLSNMFFKLDNYFLF